jgi:hypothetical protein
MRKMLRNLILLVAICAIALMIVGISVYNYIPTDITIAQASTYETSSETTKVISDAKESADIVGQITGNSSSSSSATTTIVLQTYEITKSDLNRYKNTGAYNNGKSDPFADVSEETTGSSSSGNTSNSGSSSSSGTTISNIATSGGTTSNPSGGTTENAVNNENTTNSTNTVSDGTLFNSTYQK